MDWIWDDEDVQKDPMFLTRNDVTWGERQARRPGALYGGGGVVWDEFGFGRKSWSEELVYKTCGYPYLKKTYFEIFKYESCR